MIIYSAFCLDVAQMGTEWDSNSLMKVCYSSLLAITPHQKSK